MNLHADLKRLLKDTLNVKYNLFANPDVHKPVWKAREEGQFGKFECCVAIWCYKEINLVFKQWQGFAVTGFKSSYPSIYIKA